MVGVVGSNPIAPTKITFYSIFTIYLSDVRIYFGYQRRIVFAFGGCKSKYLVQWDVQILLYWCRARLQGCNFPGAPVFNTDVLFDGALDCSDRFRFCNRTGVCFDLFFQTQ